jgi:trk system potassium uptake protein TrkH
VGTGGFGVLNSSVASYGMATQIIITVFMIICAINFNVYYLLLIKKPKEAFLNEEVRWFLVIVFASAVMIAINIQDSFSNIFEAFQTSIFQVATVISTTGYSTADFNLWPEFSKTILFFLMMIGACAGSTGGGFKISRVIIIAKAIKNELLAAVHPRSVKNVQINGRKQHDNIVRAVLCYLAIYVAVQAVSILIVSLDNFDMTTNISAVIATFNNIGPGFNVVGPTGNFGSFSILSKFVMMFDMLVGRLELLPMLVLFTPGMWNLPKLKKKKVLE